MFKRVAVFLIRVRNVRRYIVRVAAGRVGVRAKRARIIDIFCNVNPPAPDSPRPRLHRVYSDTTPERSVSRFRARVVVEKKKKTIIIFKSGPRFSERSAKIFTSYAFFFFPFLPSPTFTPLVVAIMSPPRGL